MVTQQTTQRDAILDHVGRYRLSTIDVLHRLFFAHRSRDAAAKTAQRLVHASLLNCFPLGPRRLSAYYLTHRGAVLAHYPTSAAKPFREQSLFERYAVLVFCCLRDTNRQRLTPPEFAEHFPEAAGAQGVSAAHQDYYLDDHEGTLRLARILIDHGGEARRFVRKCCNVVAHAATTQGLCDLAQHDLFMLSVLTADEKKAEALRGRVLEQAMPQLTRIEVIPELYDLM